MMSGRRAFYLALFTTVCLLFSCSEADSLTGNINRMADLECRAMALRKERFVLADKIRFAQDTLLQKSAATDSISLQQSLVVFNEEKEKLLSQSLLLADTIHKQLDSLRKFVFKNKEEKDQFDEKLKKVLAERGCQE